LPCSKQRELDVLEDVEHRDQVEALEDEAEGLEAQLRERFLAQPAGVVAIDAHRAGGGDVDAADEVQQRRLAAARGAGERDELAPADDEVDAPQGADHRAAEGVVL
jgi:hypothetical protein